MEKVRCHSVVLEVGMVGVLRVPLGHLPLPGTRGLFVRSPASPTNKGRVPQASVEIDF